MCRGPPAARAESPHTPRSLRRHPASGGTFMRPLLALSAVLAAALVLPACKETDLQGCIDEVLGGPLPIATTRDQRFAGKVRPPTARCRGGDVALRFLDAPWVDWTNYRATGDAS